MRAVPASISTFGVLMAPWMTWGFTVRAEYLGMAVANFAAVGCARTKVAGIMPPRTMDLLQIVGLAFAAVVVFAPMPVELFPYAVVLWILAEALQLLRELHASLAQVEMLSNELSEANFELQETELTIHHGARSENWVSVRMGSVIS